MKTTLCLALCAVALPLFSGAALAAPGAVLSGQKIDSGLGDLPHYSTWADPTGRFPLGHRVIGESLDDGLADLPPYAKWVDRSGRDPMGRQATVVSAIKP